MDRQFAEELLVNFFPGMGLLLADHVSSAGWFEINIFQVFLWINASQPSEGLVNEQANHQLGWSNLYSRLEGHEERGQRMDQFLPKHLSEFKPSFHISSGGTKDLENSQWLHNAKMDNWFRASWWIICRGILEPLAIWSKRINFVSWFFVNGANWFRNYRLRDKGADGLRGFLLFSVLVG